MNVHIHQWNRMLTTDPDVDQSFEGEDVYSVALGYFRALGYTWDEAHDMASSRETVL